MRTEGALNGVRIRPEDENENILQFGPGILARVVSALRAERAVKIFLNRPNGAARGRYSLIGDLAGLAVNFRSEGVGLACDIRTRVGKQGASLAGDAEANPEMIEARVLVKGDVRNGVLVSVSDVSTRVNIIPSDKGAGGLFEARAVALDALQETTDLDAKLSRLLGAPDPEPRSAFDKALDRAFPSPMTTRETSDKLNLDRIFQP